MKRSKSRINSSSDRRIFSSKFLDIERCQEDLIKMRIKYNKLNQDYLELKVEYNKLEREYKYNIKLMEAVIKEANASVVTEFLDDDVKMCICETAEFLYEKAKTSGIISENNDGYSVRFEQGKTEEGIYNIAVKWLSKSGLLYRGDIL